MTLALELFTLDKVKARLTKVGLGWRDKALARARFPLIVDFFYTSARLIRKKKKTSGYFLKKYVFTRKWLRDTLE